MTPRRPGPVTPVRMTALRSDGRSVELPDSLVTEEPLELRVTTPSQPSQVVTVTMRTPGHDFELAAGFLLSEGVAAAAADIESIKYCELPDDVEQGFNVVTVRLTRDVDLTAHQRRTTTTASCGVCGTASLDQLERRCPPVPPGAVIDRAVLVGLPDALRRAQPVFERTGGLHAAGLFHLNGHAATVREDVGRHNAVDKLLGASLLAGELPLADRVLALSGRVSFELVQKAAVGGIGIVVAVSAPSSLAVETAHRLGVTLAAFTRGGGTNLYTHPARVVDR